MSVALWKLWLSRLEDDLAAQQFNTWIRPLHAVENPEGLTLLAPNRFVRDFVHKEYLDQIMDLKMELKSHKSENKKEDKKETNPDNIELQINM